MRMCALIAMTTMVFHKDVVTSIVEWPNWIFGLKLAMSSTKGFLVDFGALICPEQESA